MIGPKKKRSQSKKRIRHSAWHTGQIKKLAKKYQLATCPTCGASRLNHRVCSVCGSYNGKQVITIKTKEDKNTVVDA